jgi:MFS family permease
MGVYAAMSVAGGTVGLIAGGLLTTYASWRWVLFVNVPLGLAVALAAPRVLTESARQRGRFDLPGAITGTGDARVVASLAASVLLLAAFAVIEARSTHPLLPLRLLRDRRGQQRPALNPPRDTVLAGPPARPGHPAITFTSAKVQQAGGRRCARPAGEGVTGARAPAPSGTGGAPG